MFVGILRGFYNHKKGLSFEFALHCQTPWSHNLNHIAPTLISRELYMVPRCYQQFFRYPYFAGIRFTWQSVFPVGITNLARTPFFPQKGGWLYQKGGQCPLLPQKGAIAPFLWEKGVPAKKMIPKCTVRDFLRYRYGKYWEIPTNTDRKIPIRYTTLLILSRRLCPRPPDPYTVGKLKVSAFQQF
jgi:hypothetical protein